MAVFNVPEATPRSVYKIEQFHGVDFTSSPEIVENDKSPNSFNMVRDAIGTVRKSVGYFLKKKYDKPVYGFYKLREDNIGLTHVGDRLYRGDELVYVGINERPAVSFELNGKLWIPDGKELLIFRYIKKKFSYATSEYEIPDHPIPDGYVVRAKEKTIFEPNYESYTLPHSGFIATSVKYFESGIEIDNSKYHTDGGVITFYEAPIASVVVESEGLGTPYNNKAKFDSATTSHVNSNEIEIEAYRCAPASEDAYIPLFCFAQPPKGGGTMLEDINLIQKKLQEKFYGDGSDTTLKLSFSNLNSSFIKVERLVDENWTLLSNGSDYTFDAVAGKIILKSASVKPTVTGEDNYKVTYERLMSTDYADRINKCTIGTLYGVYGASDRLFLSGHPDLINYDWYSGQFGTGSAEGDNIGGAYFADTSYGVIGNESSAIVGYSIINNYLATHKDEISDERTVVIRTGKLAEDKIENTQKASFPIYNTLQGPGAIAPKSFAYLATEPIFLTGSGIYAITSSDVTGEKYSQRRSYFLDGKLLKEDNLEKAFAVMYNDMYCLFINGQIYILDSLQALRSNNYDPYSTRQYAGFYRTNVPAICAWNDDRKLCFGTEDGCVYQFFTDVDDPNSYLDKAVISSDSEGREVVIGEPIECLWETSEIFGQSFYKNKTFRWIALKLKSSPLTSVALSTYRKGIWKLVKEEDKKTRYFTYSFISYDSFTYVTDETSKTIPTKIRLRRMDKAKFRFENNRPYQQFGLISFAVEYVSGNNFKG